MTEGGSTIDTTLPMQHSKLLIIGEERRISVVLLKESESLMSQSVQVSIFLDKVGWGKMGQWGKMGHLHFRGSHCLPEGNFKLRRCMNVTPSYRQPVTLISSPQEVLIESKGQNNEDRWNAAFMRTK